ncbi:hypothetical protein FOXYS1_12254 [Fusarium oxysporum]|uniref:Phenol 2-monooxygenase n=1 Tax=Fusarium oxysporum TaxID=5507 RepID=A0A8H5A5Q4_FUSOX|nr:hypothetical protein FOXYS1_12254 [Fusarium oxysporum]
MQLSNETNPKQTSVDVLIIGAGPSGLMLWTCGFERTADYFELILDSLGIGQDVWREANHMLEIRFWVSVVLLIRSQVEAIAYPDQNPDQDGKLYRSDRIVDTIPGLSCFQQATLHQARIEDHLLGYIWKHSNISVERGIMPESLSIDKQKSEDADEYAISIVLRHLVPEAIEEPVARGSADSRTETVHAKYLVGCDGAHSWTRRQIGSIMEGEQTDFVWGVLDIIPITDFPDIRYRCAIHSATGSLMVIPREDGYLDRFKTTPGTLVASARNTLAPYTLSYKHCHWWTAYRIGQRVGSKFSKENRVFLAGDAVHTHSPKAGQGMNISMHDTYNLGWKLARVIKGWASPDLLKIRDTERHRIAKGLIEFDQRFSRLFSGRPTKDIMDTTGVDLRTFKAVFEKGNLFASGCAVEYPASLIVAKLDNVPEEKDLAYDKMATIGRTSGSFTSITGKQGLASKVPIGMRMPSYKELLPSTGVWRLLVFAGDIRDQAQFLRYQKLGAALDATDPFLQRYTVRGGATWPQRLVEVLTIHSAPRVETELRQFPEVFHPFSEEYGWDYNKIFVDDDTYHEGPGRAYEDYGINKLTGCVIIVRPDQYVSWVGDLEDVTSMEQFLSAFMKDQNVKAR